MKKSLIALAVLAASGAAFAQSTVNIYGIVDVGLVKDKGQSAKLMSGPVSGSRLGFKGTEDLGGGLKATFALEQGIDAVAGTGGAFNRESTVGLAGNFGAVRIGRMFTAYDDVNGATDPVFDSALSPFNVFKSTGYTPAPNQGIHYATPNFNGFSGALSYSMNQTTNVSSHVTAFNVQYAAGPVYVALGYQDEAKLASASKFTRLNGSYDFGAAKLLAAYGHVKNDATGFVTNEYTIGVDVPVASNIVLSAGYGSSKADNEGARSNGFSLGAAYLLSKRTTVYAGYFDANATAVTNRGAADSRFALGLKHTF